MLPNLINDNLFIRIQTKMCADILIVGQGGREHALVWKLSQSPLVKRIFAAPGSFAIAAVQKAQNVKLDLNNFKEVAAWCKANKIDLVVVGPEAPLAKGIADVLIKEGISIFGPIKAGAIIEADKAWAKSFMDKYSIPTARWKSFTDAQEAKNYIKTADFPALVVKCAGLAGGKGVIVAKNIQEACDAVDSLINYETDTERTVVIEELLEGEEVSVLAFCDGVSFKSMLPAQDHKRIFENDEGPNTGGMGAYCPCPLVDSNDLKYIETNIFQKAVDGLRKENIRYVGVLYAGLMLTKGGPKVLEFNCRFGDPETEVILPLLESDLYEVLKSCCDAKLAKIELKWKENMSAVGIVLASKGYPGDITKGQVIKGIKDAERNANSIVFHCGTSYENGNILTNGGRVLISVSLNQELHIAASQALSICNIITFDGKQYRKDIALKGIARSILKTGMLTYKKSGVDISAGNQFVDNIKALIKTTEKPGLIGGIGGFGGMFHLKAIGLKDPLLISGTDGVGTKLKIAQTMGIHDKIGIDLVAMCVNDILAHGAEPLFFLDYFACSNLQIDVAQKVVSGIVEGCKQAGCVLIGGETAEMPDMYSADEYDLAGFTVGAVEKNSLLPKINDIKEGDTIIGLPSSGIHSNGFSLVRKIMKVNNINYKDIAPFSKENRTYGEEFLVPTKIYVKQLLPLMKDDKIKAFAHITGGGLTENVPRILPSHIKVEIDTAWKIPSVFGWLATVGGISENEMLRTFNCGIGAVLIVDKNNANDILKLLSVDEAVIMGKVLLKNEGESQILIRNFTTIMDMAMRPYVPSLMLKSPVLKKRVAVLISGSGTNLQALIDATLDPEQQIGAEIVLVISNKPDVEGIKRAQRANILTKVIQNQHYKSREEFDRAVHAELISHNVDFVCLAGFMRILSGEFTRNWKGKLINIHPALLPLFKGTHAQRQALESGVRVTGCTVHFVEENVDTGAIILQDIVYIDPTDSESSLIEKIKSVEHKTYPKALKLLVTGKVHLGDNNRVIWN